MTSTDESALTAEQVRKRLNEIAPYESAGGANAVSLARWLAMEAQVVWARMLDPRHDIDPRDIGTLHGYFAAAHALVTFHALAPQVADNTAREIAGAIDSPGDVGEWLWEIHGDRANEIALLADRLAALTEMDAHGHLQTRDGA